METTTQKTYANPERDAERVAELRAALNPGGTIGTWDHAAREAAVHEISVRTQRMRTPAPATETGPSLDENEAYEERRQKLTERLMKLPAGHPQAETIIQMKIAEANRWASRQPKQTAEFTWEDASRSETIASLGTPDEQRPLESVGQTVKATPAEAVAFASALTEHRAKDRTTAPDVMLPKADAEALTEILADIPEEVANRLEAAGAFKNPRIVGMLVTLGRRRAGA